MRRGVRPGGRRLRLLLTVLISALVLSGCGGFFSSSTSGGKTQVVFWDDNGGPDRTPVWQHIIAEFEKRNPGIDVQYVGVPISQVQQKYDTAIAAGGLPDVGATSTSFLSNLVSQNALEPLDGRIASSPLRGKLVKGLLDSVRDTGGDGKLYQLPSASNTGVLWYRGDWFQEAGLAPPQTWTEFYDVVPQLTDRSRNRYGFTIRGGSGAIPQVLEAMYAYSGVKSIFEGNESTVNDPRNLEALEKYVGLYNTVTPSADVNNDYPKMVAQFDGGTVAMMQHNLGSYQNHVDALGKDKIVGAPSLRSPLTGTHNVLSNPVDGLGVFKTSEHKDAAWRFAEFAVSKQMNSYWCQQTGTIPANTDVSGEQWIQGSQPLRDATKMLADPKTNLVQLPYYLPQLNPILKVEMEPLFQQVLLGELSPKSFLDQFDQKLNNALKEWNQRNG